jgi:hypothetical protein
MNRPLLVSGTVIWMGACRDISQKTWCGVTCLRPSFAGMRKGAYMEVFTARLRQVTPDHVGLQNTSARKTLLTRDYYF